MSTLTGTQAHGSQTNFHTGAYDPTNKSKVMQDGNVKLTSMGIDQQYFEQQDYGVVIMEPPEGTLQNVPK
jgi:hypothetical protein